jgi:hypothetical protein
MCATKHFPQERPPYLTLIIVEPTIVSRYLYTENEVAHNFATEMAVKATNKRRDIWDNRESAIQWLAKRAPWKYWDPRVIRLHVVRIEVEFVIRHILIEACRSMAFGRLLRRKETL